jgi:CDP-glucose 4,6-dehydratase
VEAMVIDPTFWRGRRVFLTGHTGFKGGWMTLLLHRLGAEIHGFALPPPAPNGLFEAARVGTALRRHCIGDIRDLDMLAAELRRAEPEVVIHMAAQALVRRSYADPVETYAVNVMGTVHLLEAVRRAPSVRAAVVVTSDKCYENLGQTATYREDDRLGGHDPYSNSKGCAELVTEAYRRSFFPSDRLCRVASVRAGNVVGGGDWSEDRLVPNPEAVRPWQHVIDPLIGYLALAERLVDVGEDFAGGWNFGPPAASEVPVKTVVDRLAASWGDEARWEGDPGSHPHEDAYLRLDSTKAARRLGWHPSFGLDDALKATVAWYRDQAGGADMRERTQGQIEALLRGELVG